MLLVCAAPAGAAPTRVSLTFDDATATQYQAKDMLAAHGMRGTFYANSLSVGSDPYYMSWAQLHEMADAGNEIGGHTLTHARLTELSQAEQETEVCDDRQNLISHGFDAESFAYPYAAWNNSARDVVASCGYTSGRGVGNVGCPACSPGESIPPVDPYVLRTPQAWTSTTTLSTTQGYVTNAVQHGGGWVIIVLHDICNGCGANGITPQQFSELLTWLEGQASNGVTVRTVSEVMEEPPPPPPLNVLQNPGLEDYPFPNSSPSCWERTSFAGPSGGGNIGSWSSTSDSHGGNAAERVDISSYNDGDQKLISVQDRVAANPSGVSATALATGGNLGAETFYYKVTATTVMGETQASSEVSATTTGTTASVSLNWSGSNGATGYRIYRATASGEETLLDSVGTATTYTDTGAATPGTATPPATNTALRTTSPCSPGPTPGHTYRVGAWYKTSAGVTARMIAYYRDASGTWIFWRAQPIPPAADWNHVAWLTPQVPAGATALGVGFSLLSVGSAIVDDLSIGDVDVKVDQTIDFSAPSGVRYGDPDSDLGATASSGLAVDYTSQTTGVCTIVAGQLHVVSAGSCTIQADQPGNDYYNPAPQVERTFTIGQADQTITFDAPTGVRYGDPDQDLGATASSGLAVTYASDTPSVCTIVSGQLHVVAPGDCTIQADQPGNDNYNAAPQVERTFTIAKADQTITFTAPTGVRYGDADLDLGATASSGLTVTYTSQTPSVCTIVDGQLHTVLFGTCTIDADQAGDDNYNPAPQVERTFQIAGPGYPRPKAGTPTSVPFVIAYDECLAPNRTHGPSLSFDSCNPPQQSSAELTAGTPDANSQAANSTGRVTYVVLPGDIRVTFSFTDVRKKSDLSDYTGELNVVQGLRLTDHLNPSDEIGTVEDNDFAYAVPCTATANGDIGATCALTTTANSLVPGILSAGNRAIWELGQIQIFDGGPDEVAGTAPNTVFARQGIFVP